MNKPSKQELIQFIIDNNVTSYKQLAEKYNVKTANIGNWLHSYSIKLLDYQPQKPSKSELVKFIKDNNVTSYSKLASHFNVNKSNIPRWLTFYSIKLSDFQEKINIPSKQELIQFIKNNNGSSYSQLASHFNVNEGYIARWLKLYSIKLSDHQAQRPSKQELIPFIIDNNISSYNQLMDHYDVKRSTISHWLKLYSIKLSDYSNKPSKQELIKFIKDNNVSSYNQLTEKYNVKTSTITSWLQSYSIKLSDFKEKINKPTKQELIQFIIDNNSSSQKQLIGKYNVTKSTINNWLRSYSIKLSDFKEKNKPSKQELIQFIKDNNGSSYSQLSNHYNVSKSIIGHWLKSYSIKLYDFKKNKPSKQELIQFIIDNNIPSYRQLAEHYDVAKSTINDWFKSYSIKLSDFKSETIFYHNGHILNLSDKPHKNHISIKDLDYNNVVLLIKSKNPVVYVEKDGKGKTTTPKALIEEYIRKKN